jgi:hypothetical protein
VRFVWLAFFLLLGLACFPSVVRAQTVFCGNLNITENDSINPIWLPNNVTTLDDVSFIGVYLCGCVG